MADENRRQVTVDRVGTAEFTVTNQRGAQITIGNGDSADFTPVELLLGAIGGCTSLDVDSVTSRRAEPDTFQVEVTATKLRDDTGNRLTDIGVTFRVAFPDGPAGDQAREALPKIAAMSHDRLCTVSRTVEICTPVTSRIE